MLKYSILFLIIQVASLAAADTECGRNGLDKNGASTLFNGVGDRITDCYSRGFSDKNLGGIVWKPIAVIHKGQGHDYKIELDSEKTHEVWWDTVPYQYRSDLSTDLPSRRTLIWGDVSEKSMTLGKAKNYCFNYFKELRLNFRLPLSRDFETAKAHNIDSVRKNGDDQLWVGDAAFLFGAPEGKENWYRYGGRPFSYVVFDPVENHRVPLTDKKVLPRKVRCVADFQL